VFTEKKKKEKRKKKKKKKRKQKKKKKTLVFIDRLGTTSWEWGMAILEGVQKGYSQGLEGKTKKAHMRGKGNVNRERVGG